MQSGEPHQFSLEILESAPLALKSIKQNCPDVIIIYSSLNGMSGIEFAKLLLSTSEHSQMKLIGINETQSINAKALYKDIGFDSFFEDSVSISELLKEAHKLGDPLLKNRHNLQVLLVEDNEINQVVAKDMLELLGCEVSLATNGQVAVDLFKRQPHKFNIIFMDCQMPILDGYAATRKIRRLPGKIAGSIPIIALTANALSTDRQLCIDAGMNDHIGKPISFEVLKSKLAEWKLI